MNICGVLVHARPENLEVVSERLLMVDGVEVHGSNEDGRMVVTLEQDDNDRMADALLDFQRLEGVISASMIYHHSEETEAYAEEVTQ
ncbi:chaperone NapD [Thiohalomonas denitrificans]|uniref:Chaperone NapD n=1 Tax=Thiohalomonas denitrificans TaxID=415747 RepID=A0A1G5PSC5_9GAMM|nr:chaperone NapD [Thiohalomonas denitrificans]SCZ52444.1 periplasmic nitrate reductase chaperone NapD [Thiohalomonas denitrificans]